MKIKTLLVMVLMTGCGGADLEVSGIGGEVRVLPRCGTCFTVLNDLCIDDGSCGASSACATERPDLPAMSWTNDPGLNWTVDFTCE